MLAAVDLHDEPGCDAEEVHDVMANRNLAAKLRAAEAAIAEVVPESVLRLGEVRTKAPRECGFRGQ